MWASINILVKTSVILLSSEPDRREDPFKKEWRAMSPSFLSLQWVEAQLLMMSLTSIIWKQNITSIIWKTKYHIHYLKNKISHPLSEKQNITSIIWKTKYHVHYLKIHPLSENTSIIWKHIHYLKTHPLSGNTSIIWKHIHYLKTHPLSEYHIHYLNITSIIWKQTPLCTCIIHYYEYQDKSRNKNNFL